MYIKSTDLNNGLVSIRIGHGHFTTLQKYTGHCNFDLDIITADYSTMGTGHIRRYGLYTVDQSYIPRYHGLEAR